MTLVLCKFLQSGYPKYFETFLKPRHSVYNTHRSEADSLLLEVPCILASALHMMLQSF